MSLRVLLTASVGLAIVTAGCLASAAGPVPEDATKGEIAHIAGEIPTDGAVQYLIEVLSDDHAEFQMLHLYEKGPHGDVPEQAMNFLIPYTTSEFDLFPVRQDGVVDVVNWSHTYQASFGAYYWYAASAEVGETEAYVNPNSGSDGRTVGLGGPVVNGSRMALAPGLYRWVIASTAGSSYEGSIGNARIVDGPIEGGSNFHKRLTTNDFDREFGISTSGPIGPDLQLATDGELRVPLDGPSYLFIQAHGSKGTNVTVLDPDGEIVPLVTKMQSGRFAGPLIQAQNPRQIDMFTSRLGEWRVDVGATTSHTEVVVYAVSLPAP